MPQTPKMAVTLALMSALCHIATLTVIMHTQRRGHAPRMKRVAHRNLESAEPDADAHVSMTVARLEKIVDTQGARLTSVKISPPNSQQ